jgi:predicted DsbA family dithiol-disulfide isomerase
MAVIDITIYFDTICPWCYIGHKSLAKAIELYQRTYPGARNDEIRYNLLPYYLRPDAPHNVSVPVLDAIAQKNGPERVYAITTRLQRVGRASGIDFNFNSRVGNTRDSHRVIRLGSEERRKELLEEIYRLHFEQNADITSHETLAQAAETVELAKSDVLQFLNSDEGAAEVDTMAEKARKQARVTSVPTVEIGGRRIEGAEDAGDFFQALVDAKEAITRRTQ